VLLAIPPPLPGLRARSLSDASFLFLLLLLQTRVGRAYGRVGRRLLREALLKEAAAAGVKYHPGTVEGVDIAADGNTASITCTGSGDMQVTCR
jgi:hypothetical protein